MPKLSIEHFRPHVGKQFIADCTPSEVELQLIEASPLLARNASAQVPFLLVFHTPPQRMLLPGLYTMRRDGFDPAQIHISDMLAPAGSAPGYYYQAVFN